MRSLSSGNQCSCAGSEVQIYRRSMTCGVFTQLLSKLCRGVNILIFIPYIAGKVVFFICVYTYSYKECVFDFFFQRGKNVSYLKSTTGILKCTDSVSIFFCLNQVF